MRDAQRCSEAIIVMAATPIRDHLPRERISASAPAPHDAPSSPTDLVVGAGKEAGRRKEEPHTEPPHVHRSTARDIV
jgi:hypothetical protein